MPTQQKATKISATSMRMSTQICFDSNLAYLDHSLPPLGLFLEIKLNFLSLSQIHLLRHREVFQEKLIKDSKNSPFFP
jgi:hypothetical protein